MTSIWIYERSVRCPLNRDASVEDLTNLCHTREGGYPESNEPKALDARLRGHDVEWIGL